MRRGRFQGTIQILQYNWPFYAAATIISIALIGALCVLPLPPPLRFIGFLGAGLALFWTISSIAASYYVYDVSPLCRWDWIASLMGKTPRTWANLHAGLDESTLDLRRLFPGSEGHVFDFYDADTMTEPSIRRARRITPSPVPAIPVLITDLPLEAGTLDAAFLLFAAHEIRQYALRRRFFQELHRVLSPDGQIIIAEHLRDEANFLAFGPGFLHFFPRSEWLSLAADCGFIVTAESAVTPLTRAFVLEKRWNI